VNKQKLSAFLWTKKEIMALALSLGKMAIISNFVDYDGFSLN
jgi:hypothetical protein